MIHANGESVIAVDDKTATPVISGGLITVISGFF
jgi:hypothetical protein